MPSSSLLSSLLLVVVGAMGAGCYSPGVKNRGFSCSPDVTDACPTGFYCVDGLCQDQPGTSSGVGGVGASDGGSDMTMAPVEHGDDLAMAPPAADMTLPPDMVRPTCHPASTPCLVDEECCSRSCSTLFGCN